VSLHRLRVPERVQYKITVLPYKVLQGTAPRYLGPLVRACPTYRVDAISALLALPVWSCRRFKLPMIGSRTFNIVAAQDVTSSPTCSFFVFDLKHICFFDLIVTLLPSLNCLTHRSFEVALLLKPYNIKFRLID